MSNEYIESLTEDMAAAIHHLEERLKTVRTGRASPQLITGVNIDVTAYGATMPLNQLATVTAPDPRMLVVSPWDKSTINDISKGIVAAGLGLNPSSDGSIVRVPIPALTGERRAGLARKVREYGEDSRIALRRLRKEYNDLFKEQESEKEISEDEYKRLLKQVQDATDTYVAKVGEIIEAKEQEISEV
ncbi:MAG: ribosome recycling factor [Alphaproteobacteria bacterium]|nr:ribosome recycling factor [Alphaproteobacteria bacterium]MCB9792556.1 ribosome recycling factor [Alphaproteobacteria bacterium]